MTTLELLEELYWHFPSQTEDQPWWDDPLCNAMEAAEELVENDKPLDAEIVLRDLYTEAIKLKWDPYFQKHMVALLKQIKEHFENELQAAK